MKTHLFIIVLSILSSIVYGQNETTVFLNLSGDYLGQKPPTDSAIVFAPNIISDGSVNRDVTISNDGKEMFFGLSSIGFQFATIISTKKVNGMWTKPEVVSFAKDPRYHYLEPMLSSDGTKLFFISDMPKDGGIEPSDDDIWVVDRKNDGWGTPYNLGSPVNTDGDEFFPSIAKNGNIYFTRQKKGERESFIYKSQIVNGKYQLPQKLPSQINCGRDRFNATVSPDETFIIIPTVGMKDGYGGVDYYITFKDKNDKWSEPINMGPKINSVRGREWSLYLTPDLKYIFFMTSRRLELNTHKEELSVDFFNKLSNSPANGNSDIYWISASILKDLKEKIIYSEN